MTPKRLILLLGALWLAIGTAPVVATGADMPAEVTNSMCPVLPDEPVDPAISMMYQGKSVYFCCQRCRRQFEQSPRKYVDALPHFASASGQDPDHAAGIASADEHDHDHATGHGSPQGLSRFVKFAGRFHPIVVHFPIALLLAGLAAELCFIFSRMAWFSHAARFSVLAGAAGAAVAALLGWANAAFTPYSGETTNTLAWHRWLGVGTVIIAVTAAVFSEAGRRKPSVAIRRYYVAALIAAALLVAATGHFGGTLVFGPDYFTW